jgi:hypothetical protein
MYSGKIAVPPGGGGIRNQQIWKKTIFIVEMCQNVSEEIKKTWQFLTNEV